MNRISVVAFLLCSGLFCFAIAAAPALSAPGTPPQAANGERTFNQYCAACHDTREASTTKPGPVLKHYYRHQPRPSDSAVRRIIQEGKGRMPAFSTIDSARVNDLLAYLKTL